MKILKRLIPALICILLLCGCDYIVLPEEEASLTAASEGWAALVTQISKTDAGNLHIDLTIRNDTHDWSAMQSDPGKPAMLIASDGKTSACDTVFVGSGGHRLAPGFQMRGYTAGTKAAPETQLIYVECKGAEAAAGSKLSIDYSYVTGELNYYEQEAGKTSATLEVELDSLSNGLTYPVAEPADGVILKSDEKITAINTCELTLSGITRTEKGLQFSWQTFNPGEYPTYIHIGTPPVVGSDGIIYGLYEIMDLVSVPITPSGKTAEWTTDVAVPPDVKGFYILLSVESKKQRLYTNYAMDISSQ